MAGSVAPDVDIIRFYFVDSQSVHHHEYLTHRPALWLTLLALALVVNWLKNTPGAYAMIWFALGAVLHLMLDSIAGQINWGWPFWDGTVNLVIVPASQSHWILSFLLHWTFLVELLLCTLAFAIFIRRHR